MSGLHGGGRVLTAGPSLSEARGGLILLHGRGGSAEDILGLGLAIAPEGWALRVPAAAGNTWYPNSFLVPRAQNEPYLSSALAVVDAAIEGVLAGGVALERVVLAGFSQGACLTCEYARRKARRYGGLIALTGGMIGAGTDGFGVSGDFAGTPAMLASSDPDAHVPWVRVQETADLFTQGGAKVTLRRYPGKPHTVIEDEVRLARAMLLAI